MLTLELRVEIAVLLRQGMSIRGIARQLSCSRQTAAVIFGCRTHRLKPVILYAFPDPGSWIRLSPIFLNVMCMVMAASAGTRHCWLSPRSTVLRPGCAGLIAPRPRVCPRARAEANPATAGSDIKSRSNSANAAKIPKTSFPAAVVVSIAAP